MPRKVAKKVVNEVVEETKEEKPQLVLKTEVVEEKPVEVPVVEPTPVSQLAAVIEPEKPADTLVTAPVVAEVEKKPESRKGGGLPWLVWIVLAFVLGALGGLLLSKVNVGKKTVVKPVVTKNVAVSPSVVPTKIEVKAYDRSVVKVKVLNGSGMRGKAAVAEEYLEGLGYKDVGIGNADRDDYQVSEVSVKDSMKNWLEKIKSDVSAKYTLATSTGILANDDAFDVLIIIGQK